ncbi:transporter substrate-binding domain-containing protein, partial [Lacticaseibacillus paracasei]
MKKSRLALIAGTAVLALFLASCGKYGTASSTSSSKVKTVQIVGPSASQPYQIYKSKDKLSGYNGDILAAIQKDLKNKYKFQYQVTEANSVFVGLQSGK